MKMTGTMQQMRAVHVTPLELRARMTRETETTLPPGCQAETFLGHQCAMEGGQASGRAPTDGNTAGAGNRRANARRNQLGRQAVPLA